MGVWPMVQHPGSEQGLIPKDLLRPLCLLFTLGFSNQMRSVRKRQARGYQREMEHTGSRGGGKWFKAFKLGSEIPEMTGPTQVKELPCWMKDLTLLLTPSAPVIFSCSLISNSALTQQKSHIQRKIPLFLYFQYLPTLKISHPDFIPLVSPKQVSLWSFEKLHYSLSLDSS